MEVKDLIERLVAPPGPSGREDAAAAVAEEILKDLGTVSRTPLGSLVCQLPCANPEAPLVVLEAHLDQVSLVVTAIEEGFLRMANSGGIDRRLLPATQVVVHTAGGPRKGVICSVPPHLKGDEDKPAKLEEMAIDVGYNQEQAEKLFAPGDSITLDVQGCVQLQNDHITAMALDDRAGCAAVIKAAQLVAKQGSPNRVAVLLSAMEEVGGQGSGTAAFGLDPQRCYCVDVTFGEWPGLAPQKTGKLGKGPMLGFAPILSRSLNTQLLELAKANDIALQREVMSGSTGTNADKIATTRCGVATALVSIPLRHMHTGVETISLKDVEDTARLLALAACQPAQ